MTEMKPYHPNRHHRRSIRLRGYDYTRPGAYFVTICIKNRLCLFGDVVGGQMGLNDAGKMVQTTWCEIPDHYPGIDMDTFVVMPNHIHGIIIIVGATPCGCPFLRGCPYPGACSELQAMGQPRGVAPTGSLSLPGVVHRFKTLTTRRYIDGVKQYGWPRFDGKLWQRNYYEHVIRNDESMARIRQYISDNPVRWTAPEGGHDQRTQTLPRIQGLRCALG